MIIHEKLDLVKRLFCLAIDHWADPISSAVNLLPSQRNQSYFHQDSH